MRSPRPFLIDLAFTFAFIGLGFLLGVDAGAGYSEPNAQVFMLRNELDDINNGLPKALEDVTKNQEFLLDSLDTFNQYNHDITDDSGIDSFGDDFRMDDLHYDSQLGSNEDAVVDVHVDVVFLGLSPIAIEHITDTWFNSITREDQLNGHLHFQGIPLPGDVRARYHYHVVQISDTVTEVVTTQLAQQLSASQKLSETEEVVVLNAWEVEEMMTSLQRVISASHREMFTGSSHDSIINPSGTVFVMNIALDDLQTANTPGEVSSRRTYRYSNGFSEKEILEVSMNVAIVDECKRLMKEVASDTRVDAAATDKSIANDLGRPNADAKASTLLRANRLPRSGAYSLKGSQVYWRQAVAETQKWADSWKTHHLSREPLSLDQRVSKVLKAEPEMGIDGQLYPSIYQNFRLSLAKTILSSSNYAVSQPGKSFIRQVHCSANTWVSSGTSVWLDLQAEAVAPQFLSTKLSKKDQERMQNVGETLLHVPGRRGGPPARPRRVSSGEWRQLSEDFDNLDLADAIKKAASGLKRHYSVLYRLITQEQSAHDGNTIQACPQGAQELFNSDISKNAFGSTYALHATLDQMIETGLITNKRCAIVARQIGLISSVLQAHQVIEKDIGDFAHSLRRGGSVTDDSDMARHLFRVQNLHLSLLEQTLGSSGVIHDSSHVRSTILSETITKYLSYVSAHLLSMTRDLIMPPLNLHIDDVKGVSASTSVTIKKSSSKDGGHAHSLLDLVTKNSPLTTHWTYGNDEDYGDLAHWAHVYPPLTFPTHIEVNLFVVRLADQQSYAPLRPSYEDGALNFQFLMKGIQKLKLENQDMTITVSEEPEERIELATTSCMRHSTYEDVTFEESSSSADLKQRQYQYLDPECVWAYLQPKDDSAIPSGSKVATTQSIPVFVLSVDTAHPTLVSKEFEQAVAVGGGILAVQNKQIDIDSARVCGDRRVTMNGRDPSGSILQHLGMIISGLSLRASFQPCSSPNSSSITLQDAIKSAKRKADSNKFLNKDVATDNFVYDGASVLYESPSVSSQASFSFTDGEISSSHRVRALRLLGMSRVLARQKLLQIHKAQLLMQTRNSTSTSRSREPSAYGTARVLDIAVSEVANLVEGASSNQESWAKATAAANALFYSIENWVLYNEYPPFLLKESLLATGVDIRADGARAEEAASVDDIPDLIRGDGSFVSTLVLPMLLGTLAFVAVYFDLQTWLKEVSWLQALRRGDHQSVPASATFHRQRELRKVDILKEVQKNDLL